jgi:CubicO group peptidase (beta-lactamase class C family)
VTADRERPIRILLEGSVRAGVAPGIVAGWQGEGDPAPHTIAHGRAVVGVKSVPAAASTWFDLASLTKPLVVGTLSLLVIREGRLNLDTAVAEVLPETGKTAIGAATVRHLLTHSSGLPAWAPLYAVAGKRRERCLDALGRLPVSEPGEHVVYSCPGFILLGMVLERTTDAPLQRLFAELVTRPLGIENELGYRPGVDRPLAGGAVFPTAERALVAELGFDPEIVPAPARNRPDDGNARFLDGVAGNAGLFGTVTGVLTLARQYLAGKGLLTRDEIALASSNHTPGLEQARGLGWQLATSPGCSAGSALAPTAFGHTGFTGTSVWVDPTRKLVTALLANRVHPGHRSTDCHPLRRRFNRLVVESLR